VAWNLEASIVALLLLQALLVFGGVNPQEDLSDVAIWAPSMVSAIALGPQRPSTQTSDLNAPSSTLAAVRATSLTADTRAVTMASNSMPVPIASGEIQGSGYRADGVGLSGVCTVSLDTPMHDLLEGNPEQAVLRLGVDAASVPSCTAVWVDAALTNGTPPMEEGEGAACTDIHNMVV
jgi:hypothetical protein